MRDDLVDCSREIHFQIFAHPGQRPNLKLPYALFSHPEILGDSRQSFLGLTQVAATNNIGIAVL